MERHAMIEHTPSPAITPGIRDEALFVQFSERLYDSGFLFDDANTQEIKNGERIIQEFFGSGKEIVMHYLSEEHLRHFISYLNDHPWTQSEIQQKIRLKILKAFDELAYGSRHSFNVRRNIRLELLHLPHHALQEFLFYLDAYCTVLLQEGSEATEIISSTPTTSASSKENQILEFIPEEASLEDLGSQEEPSKIEESNVLYGTRKISRDACLQFIQEYPESALKFLFRRDLTGKSLPVEILKIYEEWEARGMKRGHIRKYVTELMDWESLPTDQTILELSSSLRDQIYDLKHGL